MRGSNKLTASVVLAALALGGCGGGTKTVTVNTPPQSLGASFTPPPIAILRLARFRSPTGNIGCAIAESGVRCDIERREWSPPPRPRSCPKIVQYGQGVIVHPRGPATFVCSGDTVIDPSTPVLGYGQTAGMDGFDCISATTGMTCRRMGNTHGFFLSIQTYRVY